MHDTDEFENMAFGRVNDFLQTFHTKYTSPVLKELFSKAEANHVPIITNNVASLIEYLIKVHRPKNILELGTAYGFSTYVMKSNCESNCYITTIDLSIERQNTAKDFFRKLNYLDEKVQFVHGDFRDGSFLKELSVEHQLFDFVFVDAAKGQYSTLLNQLAEITTKDALIIFDNVLLNGWIIQENYPNHRQKTMFTRMNGFLHEIKNNNKYTYTLIPFDDGVLLLKK